MSDDLVKRLRGYPSKRGMEKPPHVTMDEAADRIEKLEAALHCISIGSQHSGATKEGLGLAARKALEGKDE